MNEFVMTILFFDIQSILKKGKEDLKVERL